MKEKDRNEIEQDIKSTKKQKTEKEENVEITVTIKRKKFNNPKIKYKKDKNKYVLEVLIIVVMLSLVIGSSYAYLTYVSKTDNNVTINAGTLSLVFQNENNTISMENAVPVKDKVGLEGNQEYSFNIKNNSNTPVTYKITLDNICQTGANINKCIPDEYIKVGIKVGDAQYKVVERNSKNEYIIETGRLSKNASQTYKMKIWLAHNTPNDYNGAGGKIIVYKGKLGLSYEQGKSNLIGDINTNNYTITHYQNRTTSEIKNDGHFNGIDNQSYFRINGISTSNVDTSWTIQNTTPFNVVAGNQYILSFYVRSENALTNQYIYIYDNDASNSTAIIWNDGTKTKLSSHKYFNNDGNWHLITETITAPVGVTSGTLNIGNDTPNLCGEGSYFDVGNIKFIDA